MARHVHYLSEHDPTGYYARQQKHREEMWPYIGACIVGMVAIVVVAALWQAIA